MPPEKRPSEQAHGLTEISISRSDRYHGLPFQSFLPAMNADVVIFEHLLGCLQRVLGFQDLRASNIGSICRPLALHFAVESDACRVRTAFLGNERVLPDAGGAVPAVVSPPGQRQPRLNAVWLADPAFSVQPASAAVVRGWVPLGSDGVAPGLCISGTWGLRGRANWQSVCGLRFGEDSQPAMAIHAEFHTLHSARNPAPQASRCLSNLATPVPGRRCGKVVAFHRAGDVQACGAFLSS